MFFLNASVFCQSKPKLMWFDATANFSRFSNHDSIVYYLDKVVEVGFTDIVVDVKPITGEVLYKSILAPQMLEWKNFNRNADFDYLNTFIEEGHKRNLKVHASLNIFCSGHNFIDRGLVYKGKSDWQSINYTDSGLVPITRLKHKYSAMTNPANDDVRKHELSVLEEIVKLHPKLDGVIIDRTRYDGIEADFSDISKKKFENYIGEVVNDFPNDIFMYEKIDGKIKRTEGKLFKKWLEWRVSVIHSFVQEARETVKKVNPNILFGAYTGAWYPLYFELGVNWASPDYDPSSEYSWATENYRQYGYANLLDIYSAGCYFYEVTKSELEKTELKRLKNSEIDLKDKKEFWYSVEGSAELSKKVVMDAVPVIGGLYVEQYADNPKQFIEAMNMCLSKTDGLMIFDIVHIINFDWWDKFSELQNIEE